MKVLIDVNNLAQLFEFDTGMPLEITDEYKTAKEIADLHPYPGDLSTDSITWVEESAVEIYEKYNPELMVLSYATGGNIKINSACPEEDFDKLDKLTIDSALRFIEKTGYTPIIVSNGNLKQFEKVADFSNIESYISHSFTDPFISGVFDPTEADIDALKKVEGITLKTREDFLPKAEHMPEVILFADDDVAFSRSGGRGIFKNVTPVKETTCTVYSTETDLPDNIFEMREYIDKKLEEGKRIALIIVEYVDTKNMPEGSWQISKTKDNITYTESAGFYWALCNGKTHNDEGFPYFFREPMHRAKVNQYPFSFNKTGQFFNPIGIRDKVKTAAVGTRSGVFHSCVLCDYTFECHCRELAESGVLMLINEKKVSQKK